MSLFDKAQIVNMSAHVLKRSRGIPDKRLMHPRREWGIGLLIFAVILIAGSLIIAQSFNRFQKIDTTNGEANISIPKYHEALISGVLEEYEQRHLAYEALVADRFSVPEKVEDATSTTAAVEVISSFSGKYVYTENVDLDENPYIEHCELAGGVFNACGSVCSPTAEICTEQCAYTCEFVEVAETQI